MNSFPHEQCTLHSTYVGHRGWLGVYLDVPGVDWDEVAEIVEEAYRAVAPARLVAELEARSGMPRR